MNKNKILVTGASGFIGSSIITALNSHVDYELAVVVRETSNTSHLPLGIQIYRVNQSLPRIQGSLLDFEPDLVIHCATLFLAEHSSENLQDLADANLIFPLNLLEAMKSAGCKNLLNIGSMWQHHEGIEANPVNLYAGMKNAFESLLNYYIANCGFKNSTLYLSDTYGPNDKRRKLVNILIEKITSKDNYPLGMSPGLQKIDLLHISDVVSGIEVLVEALLGGEAVDAKYQLSAATTYNLHEIVELLNEISAQNLNIEWGKRPYRTNEVMQVPQLFSAPKGWSPKVSLKQGLTELIGKEIYK